MSQKTVIFCTAYFRSKTEWRVRYQRWLNYYQALQWENVQYFMIDDGSRYTPERHEIATLNATQSPNSDMVQLVRLQPHLGRSHVFCYPGWWRSFMYSLCVARAVGARKIVHIESDAYVITSRLLEYIQNKRSGWTVFWSSHYRMPETGLQVICEDQFEKMEWFRQRAQRGLDGALAEHILPFTEVNRFFKGDRYSQMKKGRGLFKSRKFDCFFKADRYWTPIPDDADFATQVIASQQIEFRGASRSASAAPEPSRTSLGQPG